MVRLVNFALHIHEQMMQTIQSWNMDYYADDEW